MVDLVSYNSTDLFQVKDSIVVPHPYYIGVEHVAYASDKFGGRLGDEAIRAYEKEKKKPCCGKKGCNLFYDEHKQALLIEVRSVKTLQELEPEVKAFLSTIKDKAEADGFFGFAFSQAEVENV